MSASLYTPDKCIIAKQHLAEGRSMGTLWGKLGVRKSTMYEWLDAHPEFAEACDIGRSLGHAFWESEAIASLHNPKEFNNVVWLHTVKCQYGMLEPKDDKDVTKDDMDEAKDKLDAIMHRLDTQQAAQRLDGYTHDSQNP